MRSGASCGLAWFGVLWLGRSRYGVARHGPVWPANAGSSVAQSAALLGAFAPCGLVGLGTEWQGSERLATVWRGVVVCGSARECRGLHPTRMQPGAFAPRGTVWSGTHGNGKQRPTLAGRGTARAVSTAGCVPATVRSSVRFGAPCVTVWHGAARYVAARRGTAWLGPVWIGMAWLGETWCGLRMQAVASSSRRYRVRLHREARFGAAWQDQLGCGTAWSGQVRPTNVGACIPRGAIRCVRAPHGPARCGEARLGKARCGRSGHGLVRPANAGSNVVSAALLGAFALRGGQRRSKPTANLWPVPRVEMFAANLPEGTRGREAFHSPPVAPCTARNAP